MEDLNDIELLYQRYFTGESTATERDVLLEWIEASPDHKAQFLSKKRAYDQLRLSYRQIRPIAFVGTRRSKVKSIYIFTSAVAAACIIAFIAVFNWSMPVSYKVIAQDLSQPQTTKLPDGSVVSLNTDADFSIAEDFSKQRLCKLKGEAYFEVAPDAEHPFSISAGNIIVSVLGTKFNIKQDSIFNTLSVSVTEGLVRCIDTVSHDTVLLSALQRTQFSKEGHSQIDSVTNLNHLFWLTKKLEYKSTPLHVVAKELEKNYSVEFKFKNDSLRDCKLSAKITDNSLEEVIQILELAFSLNIEQDSSMTYVIGGNTCIE